MDKKAKFYQIYADLPLGSRDEIVVVFENEPVTWRVVKIEVDNNTIKSNQILDLLIKMGILK